MPDIDLAGLLTGLTRRFHVPAAQLVLSHGGHTATVATGVATPAGGPQIVSDTAFPLGSLTKPFTAALAMMLVADGDVELDAPVAGYLPGVALPDGVTLRRLLTHTAGLAANVTEDLPAVDRVRWAVRHGRAEELVHRPGWAFSYSNAGYLLAGLLVETVTGLSWAEAVETMLLDQLGIRPAHVSAEHGGRPVVPGHAVNVRAGTVRAVPDQQLPLVEEPAGALALSALDLAAFARLFTGHAAGPLDAGTVELIRTDQLGPEVISPFGLADGWTLGWARYGSGDDAYLGHDGTGDGTSCHLRFSPSTGSIVALTTNAATGAALWAELIDQLRADGIPVADHPVSQLRDPARVVPGDPDWAGRYVNGDAEFVVEPESAGRLAVRIGPSPAAVLTCHADGRFLLHERGGTAHAGRFLCAGADGGGRYLQVSGRLARRR